MNGFLNTLYNDLCAKNDRHQYIEFILRNIPSGLGMYLRRRWYGRRFKVCGENLTVHIGVIILNQQEVECGSNFFVGINSYIQAGGGLKCGDNVILGPYVKIWTQNHVYAAKNKPVLQQGYEYKSVDIGDDVWLGANVFVMPGVKLGNGCIVSANSVLGAKSYPDYSILAGYPAKKIGTRN